LGEEGFFSPRAGRQGTGNREHSMEGGPRGDGGILIKIYKTLKKFPAQKAPKKFINYVFIAAGENFIK
jgi:hypothetical protein